MTLIEIMVVMGLLVLLTILLSGFLLDLFRASGIATVRGGLQTEALIHSEAMLATLRKTTVTGLVVKAGVGGRAGFAATPLKTITDGGQRVWDDELTLYYWLPATHTLYEHHSPPLALPAGLEFGPSKPVELTQPELLSLFSEAGRPLSQRVVNFEFSLDADRVRFRLTLEQPVPNSRIQRYEVTREMTMLSP